MGTSWRPAKGVAVDPKRTGLQFEDQWIRDAEPFLGENWVKEPPILAGDGNMALSRPDYVFIHRKILAECKVSYNSQNFGRARAGVLRYLSELYYYKPDVGGGRWTGLAVMGDRWFVVETNDGVMSSPWREVQPEEMSFWGKTNDRPISEDEQLFWVNPQTYWGYDGTVMRTCTTCNKNYPISDFHTAGSKRGGLRGVRRPKCRHCHNELLREVYHR